MRSRLVIARFAVALVIALGGAAASAKPAPALVPKLGPPLKPVHGGDSAPIWTSGHSPQGGQTLTFNSLPLKIGANTVQLSGGIEVVNLGDWRAVAVSDVSNGEMCSLTLVGPRAVLLAAHCVDAGLAPGATGVAANKATVKFRSGDTPYRMSCEISPRYRSWVLDDSGKPRSAEDYALCELNVAVSNVTYETIDRSVALGVGAAVTLVGYGCISLGISDDDTRYTYLDGKRVLRIGDRNLEATQVTLYPGRPALYWRTLSETGKEPNICWGDSGGPLLSQRSGGPRRVIGVNSALGATPVATHLAPAFYSYLSPLSTPAFSEFVTSWTAEGEDSHPEHPRVVCGFNRQPGVQGCRA
jgi:hypothetical protein